MNPDLSTRRRGLRWTHRAVVLAAACLLGVGLLARPAMLVAQAPGGRAEVSGLKFEGARSFPAAVLAGAIVTQPTECKLPIPFSWATCTFGLLQDRRSLNVEVLEHDAIRLRLFYHQRGFRQANTSVETRPDGDDAVEVVFLVEEGEPVRVVSVEVDGAADVLPEDLGSRLPLRTGQRFSLLEYEASRDSLAAAMRNRGFPRAEVLASYLIPREANLEAQVRFEVIPGTHAVVGEIEVQGNSQVTDAVVRRMLTFRTGDVYREDELILSQSKLFGLEIFRHAAIRPDMGPDLEDGLIPVLVQVNEGDMHRVRLGAGANSVDCVNAEGRWVSRNFMGGARRLEVRGGVSNVLARQLSAFPCRETGDSTYTDLNSSVAADFVQPWFFSAKNTLGTGVFMERASVPDVFVRNAVGGYISMQRALSPRSSFTLGYRPERTRLEASGDLIFCVSFIACADRDDLDQIQVLGRPNWLSPVTASYVSDRSNAIFSPTAGHILRLEVETATDFTGSDFEYARFIGDVSVYRQISSGVVFASRLRPGWARTLDEPGDAEGLGLHPQKRFFAGGPNSVRGFAQYRLGPKVLYASAERLVTPRDSTWAGCTEQSVNDGSCDAGPLAARHPEDFTIRPVGGSVLLEGSVELRFPLPLDRWRAAAFVDVGQVWRTEQSVRLGDLAVTPGLGIRYFSPIGPIRVDLGYNTQNSEMLPVITTRTDQPGKLWPLNEAVPWNAERGIFDRLQFHFSIGQAF